MTGVERAPDGGPDVASEADRPEDEADDAHLADIPDGAGCAEVWEHLADRRDG